MRGKSDMQQVNILEKFGVRYWQAGEQAVDTANDYDLYHYECYIGDKKGVKVERGDSLLTIDVEAMYAEWHPPLSVVDVKGFGVMLRGYQCGYKKVSLDQNVNLPYVNGCATRQIFPPERVGDPTFQQLTIPPYTSEQVHHIHPTPRVVYVLKGNGYSIVGQTGESEETELKEGMVCILDPMCPHHFRTEGEPLTVLPVHVFSSGPANIDKNHPMFNGTKEVG